MNNIRFGSNTLLPKGEIVHYYLTLYSDPWDKTEKWYYGKVAEHNTKIPYIYIIQSEIGEEHRVAADHVWGMGFRLGKDGRKLKVKYEEGEGL